MKDLNHENELTSLHSQHAEKYPIQHTTNKLLKNINKPNISKYVLTGSIQQVPHFVILAEHKRG